MSFLGPVFSFFNQFFTQICDLYVVFPLFAMHFLPAVTYTLVRLIVPKNTLTWMWIEKVTNYLDIFRDIFETLF